MRNLKQQLLQGETLEFTNHKDDLINVWFQDVTNNFCLELNCKVIKATKTFKPIKDKLEFLQAAIKSQL
tara:strand:- start:699 stop:905 length:207 start_codon:yes stop_codon:yes gene_type:complete